MVDGHASEKLVARKASGPQLLQPLALCVIASLQFCQRLSAQLLPFAAVRYSPPVVIDHVAGGQDAGGAAGRLTTCAVAHGPTAGRLLSKLTCRCCGS